MILSEVPKIELFNEDCLEALKKFPDNYFNIGIVDPPYGLNFGSFNRTNKYSNGERHKANKYSNGDWDKEIPSQEYFDQLFRVTENQIICGGNYFPLPPTQCFVFWYKQNPVENFSVGELIWTSFKRPALCFDYRYYGALEGKSSAAEKVHPTQKPVQLYKFLLDKFAKPGMKILDTHTGSANSLIAGFYFGVEYTAYEINPDYFRDGIRNFKQLTIQKQLF